MTEIYLIRHSEPIRDNIEFYKTKEYQQERNEKSILSVNGENKARILSEQDELKNVDYIYSSNYVRAISTAKYIAYKNNKKITVDERFGERVFGIKDFSELPENFERHQLEDLNYKMPEGESLNEVKSRMKEALDEIIEKHNESKIVVVSHATAITCLLLNYIDLDINKKEMYFKGNKFFDFSWDTPEVFKLTFNNKELINIENIKYNYV